MATRLRRHGVGIDAIAEVLGHATLAMTRRYAHIGAETMKGAMAKLDASPTLMTTVQQPVDVEAAQTAT